MGKHDAAPPMFDDFDALGVDQLLKEQGEEVSTKEWDFPSIKLHESGEEGLATLPEEGAPTTLRRGGPEERWVQLSQQGLSFDFAPQMQVGELLDEDGFKVVYRAYDETLQRWVAIKTLKRGKRTDPAAVRRLIEEAQIMAQLEHPGVVPVHRIGLEPDGTLFFTMRLIEGRTLLDILDERDADVSNERTLQRHLQTFLQICDALAYAHSKGVVHGDINPTNVMLGDFGQVYLMDWEQAKLLSAPRPSEEGRVFPIDWKIAQLTRDAQEAVHKGEVEAFLPAHRPASEPDLMAALLQDDAQWSGLVDDERRASSLCYMAPELVRKNPSLITPQSDLFGLGAILYKLLTGRPLYLNEPLPRLLKRASQADFVPVQEQVRHVLPKQLCHILERALQKEPTSRYESVLALQSDIRHFLESGWQFERREVPPGELIVREGEPGREAYVITKGACRVFTMIDEEKVVLREMAKGEVFGETAVFTQERERTASVESIDEVQLAVITETHFAEELGIGYWLSLFIKALASRFRERDAEATQLRANKASQEALVALLVHFLAHGERRENGSLCASFAGLRKAFPEQDDAQLRTLLEQLPAAVAGEVSQSESGISITFHSHT